ncbi:MAG: NLP/P60 hydrolase [Limimaricola sp.]|uniref:C40 family peptidase n=1 Tax=Limimaricola sp. TaxID=2211665 RepID=UPI001E171CDA|nr:NlpC/P60 family protein [Limimaricola sp.]MBI1418804.1 NLP/P60 hydrolase [Limimaricola sp.]
MRDRRLTPANGRVAALSLQGEVEADHFVPGEARQVAVPVANLCRQPDGTRERQLLLGADVTVYEDRNGWAFVQAGRDGYVGYVLSAMLRHPLVATHHVATFGTHAYRDPDIKSPDVCALPFGARLVVLNEERRFWETEQGFVPKPHLWPLAKTFTDPATVAQMHFGVPYLWGGNSTRGIDCSGLVQAALIACGQDCPADSDLQRADLGSHLPDDADLQRADLVFWQGHVGMMVDDETMVHANAHHMAVAYEPVAAAILRIEAQGGGPVLARKRP